MSEIKPIRIQRSRQHKQVSPNGLEIVYVGRPSKYGNPFKVMGEEGNWFVVNGENTPIVSFEFKVQAIGYAIRWFEDYIKNKEVSELKGKNLSCWCKMGDPCHADVLLELANN